MAFKDPFAEIRNLRYADPMPNLNEFTQTALGAPELIHGEQMYPLTERELRRDLEPRTDDCPVMTIITDPKLLERLDAFEAKLDSHEEYFKTIEAILTKIQAVYETIQESL